MSEHVFQGASSFGEAFGRLAVYCFGFGVCLGLDAFLILGLWNRYRHGRANRSKRP